MRRRHKETTGRGRGTSERGLRGGSGRKAAAAASALALLLALPGCPTPEPGSGAAPAKGSGGLAADFSSGVTAGSTGGPLRLADRLALSTGPGATPSYAVTEPGSALAAEMARVPVDALSAHVVSPDASDRRIAARALGRVGGDDAAQHIAPLLRDPDEAVRIEACFAIGVTGSSRAAALLSPVLEGKPSRAEVAAIAAGLSSCTDAQAADLLVRICCREDRPVEGPESLFNFARWRGQPMPTTSLPDDRLLAYAKHPDARGRAGLGWIGRVWKDPKLVAPLVELTSDKDPEVRRAAALGLGAPKPPESRPLADADRCVAALVRLLADPDQRVAATAARLLGTYERDDAAKAVRGALAHADFNVRVAAAESLGTRKFAPAAEDLERLAKSDPSVSVRYAAATQLATIDPARAAKLVDALLENPSEYVRTAGAEVFAKTAAKDDAAAVTRLASVATSVRALRVRAAALDGLKEKQGPAAQDAVRNALAGDDPVLVAVAADVVATNAWKELLPDLRTAFARFPRAGSEPGAVWDATRADAREGIVSALAKLAAPEDAALVRDTAALDTDPGPRFAAQSALAERAAVAQAAALPAGSPPPPPFAPPQPERLPTQTGPKIPGGAPLLAKDVDLIVETDGGTMRIRLDAGAAPIHASHVAHLASRGFYDGLTFHRVVPDFVIQGGCPRGDGSGNAGVTLPLEQTRIPFEKGTLGMPRSVHPDTGGCQLFLCHSRAPHLDVRYTAFGKVVEGLDVIDRIDVDSKILRVRVAEAR